MGEKAEKKKNLDSEFKLFFMVIALFSAMVLATVLVDKSLIIKNFRYQMTIQPFIAYLGAQAVVWAYRNVKPLDSNNVDA